MTGARTQQSGDRKFEALVSAIRDYAIFMLDTDGRVRTWNLGAQAIKGYTSDEIIGRSIETFYSEEDRKSGYPAKLLAKARQEGRVEDFGWRVRKDGTRFFADVLITALRDDDGDLIGYAKVTRDLTEQRAAEERRFEQEQRFRLIVDSVRDYAICMLDTDGVVATWNPGAARIKGYAPSEIIGRHFRVFYPPEKRDTGYPEAELRTALREGRFEEEDWRVRKDGTKFWASVVLTPVFGSEGRHVGFVKVTRDLTERREAELERVKLMQAEESVRLRDEFLSVASHELRTPLMALQLQLESAQRVGSSADPRLDHKLDRAGRSVRRLTELVDALLDVSRIATGKIDLHPVACDLAEVVRENTERLTEAAVQAGCALEVDANAPVVGRWDPLRMGQVVTNLLSNAFRYAAGSAVEVALALAGDRAVLTVRDHGPGIDPQHHERIFRRFERAADTRHHGGMGLGLYVAHEIVSAHGGTIRVSAPTDGGALFTVDVPMQGIAR